MQNIDQSLKINWITTAVLVFYPLFIMGALIAYCTQYDTGWFEWSLAIGTYYIANISVGVGLHRLWAHGAYKTNKYVEFILMMLSSGTLQGPVIAWSSDHALHHTYMDQGLDPHSPSKYKNRVLGFFWSHLGWMLVGESSRKHIERGTMKRLGKNKLLMFQLKYYWQLAVFMNVIVPFFIGYCFGGDLRCAIAAFVFMGLGRALQQQMTFCVNSLCHYVGTQPYLNGTPGDINWLFFLLLGENWHNFHHAFARDYRNGWKRSQLDIHKWIIYGMSKLGIARDLVVTSTERILAKQHETKLELEKMLNEKAALIESNALDLAEKAKRHLISLEKNAGELAVSVKKRILKLEKAAQNLVLTVKNAVCQCSLQSQERIFAAAIKKLSKLEELAVALDVHLCNKTLF